LTNSQGELVSLDARPSDAIALALRLDCPIFVKQKVLDLSASSTQAEPDIESDEPAPPPDDWPDLIG
jgi:bifunctional DNase/RNase